MCVLEGSRVPFLALRLILLVVFIAFAIEDSAGNFRLIEITTGTSVHFAVDGIKT